VEVPAFFVASCRTVLGATPAKDCRDAVALFDCQLRTFSDSLANCRFETERAEAESGLDEFGVVVRSGAGEGGDAAAVVPDCC
jgi:hypothetical protein